MSHLIKRSLGTCAAIFETFDDPTTVAHDVLAGNILVYCGGALPIWYIKIDSGSSTNVQRLAVLDNWSSTVAPGVNDDIDLGYSAGSKWYDTVLSKLHMCVDASDGAAVWVALN